MIFIAYSKQLLRFCVGTVTDWVSRNATWNYSRESFSYQMPAFDKVYSSEILRQFITLHLGRAFRASLGKEKKSEYTCIDNERVNLFSNHCLSLSSILLYLCKIFRFYWTIPTTSLYWCIDNELPWDHFDQTCHFVSGMTKIS